MTDQFDGDVAFILTPDGGQIIYSGGQPLMDAGGLENAVNISLFTGPEWWANALNENESDRQIGSDFEERIRPRAITTAYLRDVEDAARDALQWMINQKIAQTVEANAVWPELNQVDLDLLITKPDGETVTVRYELNWEAGVLFPVTAKVEGI
ncbi:phage GP46 family protein [Candidatus Pacearchaeota archaeon]|nr:phage GP46 family protein [Candidatus Pacearchaeota archaeon]